MKTHGGPRLGLMMTAGLCLACQLVSPGEGGLKLPGGLKPPALPVEPHVGDGNENGPKVSLPDETMPLPPLPAPVPGTGPGSGAEAGQAPRPGLRASFYAGVSPQGLAVGDFNEDGAPDVVINAGGRNFQDETVARTGEFLLLRNDGAGKLERVSGASPQTSSGRIGVGDLDADGHLDVVLGTQQGLRLLRGLGTGELREWPVPGESDKGAVSSLGLWPGSAGRSTPWSIAHAHAPRPGSAGVFLTSARQDGPWSSQPLTRTGGKDVPVLSSADEQTPGVVADFNADGLPDVALSDTRSGAGNLQVLLNTGGGVLASFGRTVGMPLLHHLHAVDFDRDGNTDVLGVAESSLTILRGTGYGEFLTREPVQLGAPTSEIAVVDYDGDGYLDIVALHPESAEVSLVHGGPGGLLQPHARMSVGRAPSAAAVADLDRDGTLELLITEADDNAVSVYAVPIPPASPPEFGPGKPPATPCPLEMEVPSTLAPRKLNELYRMAVGEGNPSLLVTGSFGGRNGKDLALTRRNGVALLLNQADGTFRFQPVPATAHATGLSAGDLDGDGLTDLAVGLPGSLAVVWNDARTPFETRDAWVGGYDPLSGDFNGDGATDLAASFRWGGFQGGVRRFTQQGWRTFRDDLLLDYNEGSPPASAVASPAIAGDYNGDGRLDLVYLSRGLNLIPTEVNGTSRPGHGFAVPRASDSSSPWTLEPWSVDVTGDGKPDVLLREPASRPRFQLYPGDGYGSLLAPFTCLPSIPGPILEWADVNGDGLLDVLGLGADHSSLWILHGRGQGRWHEPQVYALGARVETTLVVDLMGGLGAELAVVTGDNELVVFQLP